jgi:hypothetical protein
VSTSASSKRRPTIWSPTGKPSPVKPQGTEAAGWPVRVEREGKERKAGGPDRAAADVGGRAPDQGSFGLAGGGRFRVGRP